MLAYQDRLPAQVQVTLAPRTMGVLNDLPVVVVVQDGRPIDEWMRRKGLTEDEVLEEARRNQGIERMDQINYAVLERYGGISVIPSSG